MADDNVFRQTRQQITPQEVNQPEAAQEPAPSIPQPSRPAQMEPPFAISGNIPPEFKAAMQLQAAAEKPAPTPEAPKPKPTAPPLRATGSDALEGLLERLSSRHQYEEFSFPSKSKFYTNIPETINIRAMTGEEEQILATPRYVKRGKAIDMIFNKCIKENINTEELLSVDRTHLLIYLRGISYTPDYDVEISCPHCNAKYSTIIDLNTLDVDFCPDDFDKDSLSGVLPSSGFSYSYRLGTGADEQQMNIYKEKRVQDWGAQIEDDSLLYRTALLLERIEDVTNLKELQFLLKKLPILDVSHLRNEINNPPFGVNTTIEELCPSCSEEFKIDLPLETNFFFPRKKEQRTQA